MINFSVKMKSGVTLTIASYHTLCSINVNYAPSKPIFFRGIVSGMNMCYSGRVLASGEIQGYHNTNDLTLNWCRLGEICMGTIFYSLG